MRISAGIARRLGARALCAGWVLCCAASSTAVAEPSQAEFDALKAQVRAVSDRLEIQQLIVEYGHLLDTHDLVGYSNLFAQDGEWIGGFGRAKGPAAILAMMNKYIGTAPFDPKNVRGMHLLTNIIVHVDGNRATAWSRIIYMVRGKDDRPAPALGGHYDDTLTRENGHWKFLRRVVMMEIPFQDPRELKGEPPPAPISSAAVQSDARRLQSVQDRQAIEELFTAYGATLDRRDFTAFGQLFAEDAEYVGGPGEPTHGRAAIQAQLERTLASNPSHLPEPAYHLYFNPSIEVDGDRASAHSKGAYLIPDVNNGGARVIFFVSYEDALARQNGRWVFTRREIRSAMPGTPRPAAAGK